MQLHLPTGGQLLALSSLAFYTVNADATPSPRCRSINTPLDTPSSEGVERARTRLIRLQLLS